MRAATYINALSFDLDSGHTLRVAVVHDGRLRISHTNGQAFELQGITEFNALRDALNFIADRAREGCGSS